jgi:TolB-like protein
MRPAILTLVFLLCGCAAKRALHQAQVLEQSAQLESAAAAYLEAWDRKPKSQLAREGYARTAQRLLDDRMGVAIMSYRMGGLQEGDRDRQTAVDFRQRIATKGIDLRWNKEVDDAREEARRREAEAHYRDAEAELRVDRFTEAIALARECLKLDPAHKQAPHLIRMAEAEPLYREGLRAEELGLWRKAHERYAAVSAIDAAHRDVMARMEACREKARFTLAYLPVQQEREKRTILGFAIGSGPVDLELAGLVQRELLALKDPFLQVIDRGSTDVILAEQRRQMSGNYNEQMAQAGKLLGARYLLTGRVTKYDDLLKRDLEVQVQLIDAQTGRIHLSEQVRAAKAELARDGAARLTDLAARRIAERLRGFAPEM